MKNLIYAVLFVLSVCFFPAFAETAHAAQQGSILQQGHAMLKPLHQPLVVNQSAMLLPLCSSLPQAIEKVEDIIHDLRLGLSCEGHFNEDNFYNYRAQVNGCCSPQKSFSVQEQQAAGCLESDTVKQCMDKLTGYCINNVAEKGTVKNHLDFYPKRADDISSKMKELSEQMKKLRSLIQ
jgi:hypothetical protein